MTDTTTELEEQDEELVDLSEDEDQDEPGHSTPRKYMSYADFGARFFEQAITPDRILEGFAEMAGSTFDLGPMGVGPIGLVKVSAKGKVGSPTITRDEEDEHVAFDVAIPVDLQLLIDLGLEKSRFRGAVTVTLRMTARAAPPLRVVMDVEPPTKRNVKVRVQAEGLRASVLQIVAGVDGEIRRFVAKYVADELNKPELAAARDIDIAAQMASFAM